MQVGDVYRTVVNSTFSFFSANDPRRNSDILLAQTVTSKFISGRNEADSVIEATAWVSGKMPYDTKLWTIETGADAGGIWGGYYRTITYGCCGDEDTYAAFDDKTGKFLFAYSAGPLSIEAPDSSIKRTVSYISPRSVAYHEWAKKFPDAGGVLTLYSGGEVVDRVIVDSQEEQLPFSPILTLVSSQVPNGTQRLTLFPTKPVANPEDAIGGFSIKLSFDSDMVMILPVSEDRFDIKSAILPKWVSITRIPTGVTRNR